MGGGNTDKTVVDTITIDNYCQTNRIGQIDILKSDTQGFEFEVFQGAIEMMKYNNIKLIYFEFIFSDMYKELPAFDQVYKFLTDNNFKLFKFYNQVYLEGKLSFADILFVNSSNVYFKESAF